MDNQAQTETQVEEAATLQDVAAKSFGPADMDAAQTYIGSVVEICGRENVDPVFNFDTDKELPEGYGLSVIPMSERVAGSGNVVRGVTIAAVPTVDSILNATGGLTWVQKQIGAILNRAVKAAATPNEDGAITSLPLQVLDFITSTRTSALSAFNAIAPLYVKALKDKGLKFINKGLLRQVLASAAFAEQQFPRVGQENWEVVLKSMVAHAAKEGEDAGILAHWLKTRDQIEVDTAEIDLSDIENMLASEEAEAETQGESNTAQA